MAGSKTNIQRLQEQAEKHKKKERESFIGKVEGLVQKSYNDIPTFPYGYRDEARNPKGREAPKWVKKPQDFIHDWLSSSPTEEELNNFYGQLDQYLSSMSPHMLRSSRNRVVSDTLTQKGTAITPVCFKGMKHLYHIIRFRNADGSYLEFLRQNTSGYTLAFRLFDSLDQVCSAYWCCFSDEVEIAEDLKGIFKFKKTQYDAAYSCPAEVRFGRDTFDLGFHLLGKVYEQYANVAAVGEDAVGGDVAVVDGESAAGGEGDVAVVGVCHDNRRDDSTVVVLHFYFFVLGECPRSDLFKKKMYATIETEYQNDCEPVGMVFDGAARHWNYACKAALLLRLMIKDIKISSALKLDRPDIYVEVKKELQSYSSQAQLRCREIVGHVKNIQEVFKLQKEMVFKRVEEEIVCCYMYKKAAYNRIVDGCLSLVMYSELVLGVALRERGYSKPLYLEDFAVKESSTTAVDAEASFVVDFKSFATKYKEAVKEHQPAILLSFLGSAVVFLERWGYSRLVNDALDLNEVNKWCRRFEDCKQSKSVFDAGRSVLGEWLRETKTRTEAIKEGGLKEAQELDEAIKEEGLTEAHEQNEPIKEAMVLIDLKAALKALIRFIEQNMPLDGSDVDSGADSF